MPTRRDVLKGAVLSAAFLRSGVGQAAASQPQTAVSFDVPAGACDCHTHVIGDPDRFPFFAGRVYTPEPASVEELSAMHKALGIERVVIVTPSFYGTDNAATLAGMAVRGKTARGVAVIDDRTTESELDALAQAGIRGVRVNLSTVGSNDPETGRRLLFAATRRIQARGWHVQIYTNLKVIAAIKDVVVASAVPVVFDHFGGAVAALGVSQPGFADLVDLIRSGKAYVKVSGVYRASTRAPDYADCTPLARALIAANPARVLWGSDWPHPDTVIPPGRTRTDVLPPFQIDDGRVLNQLPSWAADASVRRQILVDNPARLYGFT